MKPTQITELFANIRKTFVSFFSILMFVALGVGIFAGISWSSNALQNAAEGAFDKGSFHHMQVVFPYGLTQEDVDEIAKIEGVSKVETGRQAFATYKTKKTSKNFKLQTAGGEIDKLDILVDTAGKSIGDVSTALKGTPGFSSLTNDKSNQQKGFNQFSSVSRAVVLIYLALAILMAIVVLLNLNVMFIEEKKRELTVLMINGFSAKQAKSYIRNDTIVLTILGIMLGLALGAVMGSITVASVEPDTAVFAKGIAWRAIAAGTVGSAVLAAIMSAISLRRIPHFDLTDINKV